MQVNDPEMCRLKSWPCFKTACT